MRQILLLFILISTNFIALEAKEYNGFFNFTTNEKTGKVSFFIKEFDKEFLMVSFFASGFGSNDIGFDRGKIGSQRLVKFSRYGGKVLLHELNTGYKANSQNKFEVKAVEDAFATSILFAFQIEKDTAGIVTIDFTPFLTEDWNNVSQNLKDQKQGAYKLDKIRSAVSYNDLLAFPNNVEFESWLTFIGEAQGDFIKSVVPSDDLVSYRQHLSLIALPDPGYKPRRYHPFSGFFDLSYYDYASPIHEPIEKKFILRHRLEKKNSNAKVSEAKEPIIYYIDPGCPEPIKSVLMEGASWWNQAFEAAGFLNAFLVKELPEGAHQLDVRYNTIQWVHRSTRGWSYGSNIHDPRTGEIIKGHVSLGSLRVRQDFMIAQGLMSIYKGGDANHSPMAAMALNRLKQLSAHEVGHTIGLAHNFAASINERASVMDYPHPLVQLLSDSTIDLSKAYDDKIGIWDKRAIIYGYSEFNSGNEEESLHDIINETKNLGLKYMSDPDSRPDGSASGEGHLWDNGNEPISELKRIMNLRKNALKKFGLNSIVNGVPISELEKVLVPVYYMQRYQVEAVSKLIGGSYYEYAVKGDTIITPFTQVGKIQQKVALKVILNTTDEANLKLNDHLLSLLYPSAYGYDANRESFKNETGYGFDQLTAAASAIDHCFNLLFNKQRLQRINNQKDYGLEEYFNDIDDMINSEKDSPISLLREKSFIFKLIGLSQNYDKSGIASHALNFLIEKNRNIGISPLNKKTKNIHYQYLNQIITRLINHEEVIIPPTTPLPPGAPIGCTD